MKLNKGLFISFEGPEASGKSSQISLLSKYLKQKKIPFIVSREPGGTDFAEKLRKLILDNKSSINNLEELLLLMAARSNHINEVITLREEMDGVSGIFKLTNELKKRNFDKIFIFNSSIRYNLIARLAGIKSIYQYPLFRSKDNIVLSAKIFTEDIINEVVSTEPNLIIKKKK